MKALVSFVLALSSLPLPLLSGQGTVVYWSEHSTQLPHLWDSSTKPVVVSPPKGNLSLHVARRLTGKPYPEDELVPDYYIAQNRRRMFPAIHPYNSPSVLWSPSSELLAVMSTDGGLVGSWNVYVYSVSAQRVIYHDVMRYVRADLARRYPAGLNPSGEQFFSDQEQTAFARDTTWVNVVACGWLTKPERLVVTAGVPPSSRYGQNMGKEVVYIVEPLGGRILRRYERQGAKRELPKCLSDSR